MSEKKLIELHLHLDGSLRPETVWELSKEQGIAIPASSPEDVKFKMEVPEDCKTLEEYLERFALPLMVLQRADAIERVTFELVEDLAKEGVTYAEIRFAPQLSVSGGLTQDQVVEAAIRGAERGMKEYPRIRVGLILCCMRGDTNQELNMQTVETAKKYLGSVVCAVDIAGAEGLFPTEMFAPVFAKVREYGLPMTIHAGEAAGPDSMRTALSYGTKRIGHGVAAIEDPELVKRLFESEVTEVKDGIVEIKSIAREAGSRSKIAVWSNDPDVDPVGACVGMNGARVNAIVQELRGEKIDIINWSDNPAILIENSLSPAKVISVMADPDEKAASVIVPDYQLSLAIGKEGQNARLAARLTGFKIDIKSESQAIESGELPENYMELMEGVYEQEYEEEDYDDNYEENGEEFSEE